MLAVLAGLSSSTAYATCTQSGDVFTCAGSSNSTENIFHDNAIINIDADYTYTDSNTINNAFDIISYGDLTLIQAENGGDINTQNIAFQIDNFNSSVTPGTVVLKTTGKISAKTGIFMTWLGQRGTISIHTKGDIETSTDGSGIRIASGLYDNAELLSIVTEGKITAGDGIIVEGSNIYIETKGDIEATSTSIGNGIGINAYSEYGDVSIKTSGKINAVQSGIDISQDGGNTNFVIENDVSSVTDSAIQLWKANYTGTGSSQLHIAGNIHSEAASGVYISQYDDGDLILNVDGNVSGAFGITVNSSGATVKGNTYITTSSDVTGNDYSAMNLSQVDRGELVLHVKSGTVQGVGTTVNMYNKDSVGDTTLAIDTGAVIEGFSLITHNDANRSTSVLVDVAGKMDGMLNSSAILIDGTMDQATLAIRNGWDLLGTTTSRAQANKTVLKLYGDENSSLDLSRLGDDSHTNAILGFNHFEKADNSVWTLTGNNEIVGTNYRGTFDTATISEGGVVLDNATFVMSGSDALTIETVGRYTAMVQRLLKAM